MDFKLDNSVEDDSNIYRKLAPGNLEKTMPTADMAIPGAEGDREHDNHLDTAFTVKNDHAGLPTRVPHVKSKKRVALTMVSGDDGKKVKFDPIVVVNNYQEMDSDDNNNNNLEYTNYGQELVSSQEVTDMERDFANDEKQATRLSLSLKLLTLYGFLLRIRAMPILWPTGCRN